MIRRSTVVVHFAWWSFLEVNSTSRCDTTYRLIIHGNLLFVSHHQELPRKPLGHDVKPPSWSHLWFRSLHWSPTHCIISPHHRTCHYATDFHCGPSNIVVYVTIATSLPCGLHIIVDIVYKKKYPKFDFFPQNCIIFNFHTGHHESSKIKISTTNYSHMHVNSTIAPKIWRFYVNFSTNSNLEIRAFAQFLPISPWVSYKSQIHWISGQKKPI